MSTPVDRITIQGPVAATLPSMAETKGEAAINVARNIGSTEDVVIEVPSAGISSPATAIGDLHDPDSSVLAASTGPDIAPQRTSADGLIGMRAPASTPDIVAFGAMGRPQAAPPSAAATSTAASTELQAPIASSAGANSIDAAPMAAAPAAAPRTPSTESPPTASAALPAAAIRGGERADPTGASPVATQQQATTTLDQHVDGDITQTRFVDGRPDAPQIIVGGVTSNLMATALRQADATAEPRRVASDAAPEEPDDVATWQLANTDGQQSFAAIDVGAKQTAQWSDAEDQSTGGDASEAVAPAQEETGLDAPRPKMSIATGAVLGAVLSATQATDPMAAALLPPGERGLIEGNVPTGIASSAILNAAMIPGWPQFRFAANTPTADAMHPQQPDPAMQDEEMLAYLVNLGADDALLAKVRKALEKPVPGRKITFYLASLATAMSVVFKSLAGELDTMSEEDLVRAEARHKRQSRGKETRRERLYLE